MSYRIKKGEGLAEAFGRIAAEEIDLAVAELDHQNQSEAVHSARKAIKRLRALLRSLRVAFPKKMFKAENQRLAAAARKISPLRDVHVQLRTLGKLRDTDGEASRKVRADLLRHEQSSARKIPALRKEVRRMLHESRGRLASWPVKNMTPDSLAAGLKRIYKQGQAAFKSAGRDPVPDKLHEWRKSAKAMGYSFDLIDNLLSKKMAKAAREFEALGILLGDDHDLFLVQQALERENQARPSRDYSALTARIFAKRAKLQKKAFKLGRKNYAEKPREFARRLDRQLKRRLKKP